MKKILMLILPVVLLTACVDSLDDYNIDQKRAATTPPGALFSNALKGVTDLLTTPNVNTNNFRLFVQYWTTTTYLDEPRYNMTQRLYSQNQWNAVYVSALADLKEARRILDADIFTPAAVKNNQLGIIGIFEVYSWNILINTFGAVPYEEALNIENVLPKYEDAETTYGKLLDRLDASLALLTPTADSFDEADLIYEGNVAQWVKFGNSLKLKMGMLLADKNPTKAKTVVEAAAAQPLLAGNGDNASFPYITTQPNNNPISQNLNPDITSREDFIIASPIVDKMAAVDDPRMPYYFTEVDGDYVGGVYGFANEFADFSHPSDLIIAPDFEALLMDYAEVEFLLAEAAERGFTVPGAAVTHYNAAIAASIKYWMAFDSNPDLTAADVQAAVDAYLLRPDVNYATAAPTWQEKIGTQKWIALFNRGWDAWVEWRRLDYPVLTPPLANLKIPVRMIYPVSEQTSNTSAWESAKTTFLGGTDSPDVRLFWDTK
jgi:hypothetical protein